MTALTKLWKAINDGFHALTNWLLISSANPTQASLTFKGILLAAVPTIMMVAGWTHVIVTPDSLGSTINDAATALQDLLFAVAGIMTAYGALRKLFLGVLALYEAVVG